MAQVNNVLRAEVDFIAYEGDSFDPVLTYNDSNGDPISFADVTLKMQIRTKNGALLKTITNGAGMTITGNQVAWNTLMDIAQGVHYYDLELTYQDGKIKTLMGGKFSVIKSQTKAE